MPAPSPLEAKLYELTTVIRGLDLAATLRFVAVLDDVRAQALEHARVLEGERKAPGRA